MQSLTNDSLKQILNQKIVNNTNISLNLTGMGSEEIVKFQEWLKYRNFNTGFGVEFVSVQYNLLVLTNGNNLVVNDEVRHTYWPGVLNSFRSTYSMILAAISIPVAPSIPSRPGEEFTSITNGPRSD